MANEIGRECAWRGDEQPVFADIQKDSEVVFGKRNADDGGRGYSRIKAALCGYV
jgi:hypothetical protein